MIWQEFKHKVLSNGLLYLMCLFQCSHIKLQPQNWKSDYLAGINQILLVSHNVEPLDHLNSNCFHWRPRIAWWHREAIINKELGSCLT